MASMDIFRQNAFSTTSLVSVVETVPYFPSWLGSIPGLFIPKPVRTTTFAIESRAGVLSVIPTSERGEPLEERTTEKREIRDFRTMRIAKKDRISASEIQNIRAFGSETELMQVQDEVTRRMGGPTGLRQDVEYTWEYHRLGAVQGVVYDADGVTVLRNWFTEWGVTQDAEINFNLPANTAGTLRKLCNEVVRQTLDGLAMGSIMPDGLRIVALCGNTFWDDLTVHQDVEKTYLNQQEASELRKGTAYQTFDFGGITWVNYRSSADGKVGIGADKVKFFPVLPGLFEVGMSPGESFDWVNTLGKPVYPLIIPDKDRNMWVDVEVYSYPLFVCKRPKALQRGKRT